MHPQARNGKLKGLKSTSDMRGQLPLMKMEEML